MKNICVFCGSGYGKNNQYKIKSQKLGELLAQNGMNLIFGGGTSGLMKIIADSVFLSGGKVIGVVPQKLADAEDVYPDMTEMHITGSMHEAKQLMEQLSDAFVALPGGIGTLDELTEIMTLNQLGFIKKPCGILNVDGYFDIFISLLTNMIGEEFLKQADLDHLILESDEKKLLKKLINYKSEKRRT